MFSLDDSKEGRARLFDQVHPAVRVKAKEWTLLLDAIDGEGGFSNGDYLWKFPREIDTEWLNRKAQARYHNYADTIAGFYVRKVLGSVQRQTKNADLEAWWADVDGGGTGIDDFLTRALLKALTAGHVGILVDKTTDTPTGPARADERARVLLAPYLPTHILDWRMTSGDTIASVKLREWAPESGLLEPPKEGDDAYQMLLWDADEWVRVPREGAITRAPHGLGQVPLVVLAPLPSGRWPLVGRGVMGNGSLLRALYNRQSEEDDVLRNQAFSVFVVSVPTDVTDMEQVKRDMGTEIGTTRALFVRGSGDYATPDMGVPAEIRTNQQHLIRELYRIAHVPYDNDSKDIESGESKKADWEEISGVLRGVAEEMHRVEMQLARLWCAWQSATPDAAETLFEAADISITYPTVFFAPTTAEALEADAAMLRLEIGPEWDKVVKRDAVRYYKPALPQETLDKIDQEIESGAGIPEPVMDPSALRREARGRMAALVGEDDAA